MALPGAGDGDGAFHQRQIKFGHTQKYKKKT